MWVEFSILLLRTVFVLLFDPHRRLSRLYFLSFNYPVSWSTTNIWPLCHQAPLYIAIHPPHSITWTLSTLGLRDIPYNTASLFECISPKTVQSSSCPCWTTHFCGLLIKWEKHWIELFDTDGTSFSPPFSEQQPPPPGIVAPCWMAGTELDRHQTKCSNWIDFKQTA